MTVDDWIQQAVGQRADEIRQECGMDDDLQDDVEEMLDSLDLETKEQFQELIDRMERNRMKDNANVYRYGFRDGLRYAFQIIGGFQIEFAQD